MTPFAGYRRYFLCPKCGRRCRYLYLGVEPNDYNIAKESNSNLTEDSDFDLVKEFGYNSVKISDYLAVKSKDDLLEKVYHDFHRQLYNLTGESVYEWDKESNYDREVQCGKCARIGYGASKRSKYYKQSSQESIQEGSQKGSSAPESDTQKHKKSRNRQIKTYVQMLDWMIHSKNDTTLIYAENARDLEHMRNLAHFSGDTFPSGGRACIDDYSFAIQAFADSLPYDDETIDSAKIIVNREPLPPELEKELKQGLYGLPYRDWRRYFDSHKYFFLSFECGEIRLINPAKIAGLAKNKKG